MRKARFERKTGENEIKLEVVLDGEERGLNGSTGTKFFDHVLNSLLFHGNIYLDLEIEGDTDPHHRIEDVAIAFGNALKKASGSKIQRFADSKVPMDESISSTAIDFGGRPYASVSLPEGQVGSLPSTLFEHFFRTFAYSAKATIHMETKGKNMHHAVEASFKSLGISLRKALERREEVRSTKEVLD